MLFRPRRAACLAAVIVLGAGPAAAQTPPPTSTAETPPAEDPNVAEARRRYQQGVEFYRRGRYAEAVAEFTEAYTRWQNPTILYSLAQAYEGLSDVNRAIDTYQRYLSNTPENDARRADVQAKLVELERLLATVTVECNVAAGIFIDGEFVSAAPGQIRLATGRHEIEVRAEGYISATQTIIVAGGTERTLAYVLDEVPQATTTQIVTVQSDPFRFPRPMFYASVGVTAASAIAWGSLATAAIVQANDYNDDPDRSNLDRARAREVARTSNIMLGVTGGAAVVTTLVGIFTEWDDEDEEEDGEVAPAVSAGVEPLPGGAVAIVRWTR